MKTIRKTLSVILSWLLFVQFTLYPSFAETTTQVEESGMTGLDNLISDSDKSILGSAQELNRQAISGTESSKLSKSLGIENIQESASTTKSLIKTLADGEGDYISTILATATRKEKAELINLYEQDLLSLGYFLRMFFGGGEEVFPYAQCGVVGDEWSDTNNDILNIFSSIGDLSRSLTENVFYANATKQASLAFCSNFVSLRQMFRRDKESDQKTEIDTSAENYINVRKELIAKFYKDGTSLDSEPATENNINELDQKILEKCPTTQEEMLAWSKDEIDTQLNNLSKKSELAKSLIESAEKAIDNYIEPKRESKKNLAILMSFIPVVGLFIAVDRFRNGVNINDEFSLSSIEVDASPLYDWDGSNYTSAGITIAERLATKQGKAVNRTHNWWKTRYNTKQLYCSPLRIADVSPSGNSDATFQSYINQLKLVQLATFDNQINELSKTIKSKIKEFSIPEKDVEITVGPSPYDLSRLHCAGEDYSEYLTDNSTKVTSKTSTKPYLKYISGLDMAALYNRYVVNICNWNYHIVDLADIKTVSTGKHFGSNITGSSFKSIYKNKSKKNNCDGSNGESTSSSIYYKNDLTNFNMVMSTNMSAQQKAKYTIPQEKGVSYLTGEDELASKVQKLMKVSIWGKFLDINKTYLDSYNKTVENANDYSVSHDSLTELYELVMGDYSLYFGNGTIGSLPKVSSSDEFNQVVHSDFLKSLSLASPGASVECIDAYNEKAQESELAEESALQEGSGNYFDSSNYLIPSTLDINDLVDAQTDLKELFEELNELMMERIELVSSDIVVPITKSNIEDFTLFDASHYNKYLGQELLILTPDAKAEETSDFIYNQLGFASIDYANLSDVQQKKLVTQMKELISGSKNYEGMLSSAFSWMNLDLASLVADSGEDGDRMSVILFIKKMVEDYQKILANLTNNVSSDSNTAGGLIPGDDNGKLPSITGPTFSEEYDQNFDSTSDCPNGICDTVDTAQKKENLNVDSFSLNVSNLGGGISTSTTKKGSKVKSSSTSLGSLASGNHIAAINSKIQKAEDKINSSRLSNGLTPVNLKANSAEMFKTFQKGKLKSLDAASSYAKSAFAPFTSDMSNVLSKKIKKNIDLKDEGSSPINQSKKSKNDNFMSNLFSFGKSKKRNSISKVEVDKNDESELSKNVDFSKLNDKEYRTKTNDTLFKQITNAYVRFGYPRLLERNKIE